MLILEWCAKSQSRNNRFNGKGLTQNPQSSPRPSELILLRALGELFGSIQRFRLVKL